MTAPRFPRPIIQALERFSAVRFARHTHIKPPNVIRAIVVVGSSGSGKSTMIRALRDSDLARRQRLVVPSRYITRTRRPDDVHGENIHVSDEEFDDLVRRGDIRVHWTKRIGVRHERYGFPPISGTVLPVYSGNNALVIPSSRLQPEGFLESALVIAVYAPPRIRAARLAKRSPELFRERPDYVRSRLNDDGIRVLQLSHLVVHNFGRSESVAADEIVELLEVIHECT